MDQSLAAHVGCSTSTEQRSTSHVPADDERAPVFAQHFQVIRYDVRGFGQSIMPVGAHSDRDDLHGLLAALGITEASVLGLSKGAMIALDYPQNVDALILASPALDGATSRAVSLEQDAEIDAVYETGDLAGAVELKLRRWVDGPRRTPGMVDRAVRQRVRKMDMHNFDLAGEDDVEQPSDPPATERLP